MGVSHPFGHIAGKGIASSKKKSRTKTAYNALVHFRIIDEDEEI